ncbi:MAG: MBL fold metallo-hydrolase [Bacteriovoracaceae bacterium]|nr:MBL fold metallo-hydrolase [Bacteriovoracaceae bacterium]
MKKKFGMIAALFVTSCAPNHPYRVSDHYNGEIFTNLDGSGPKSWDQILKWMRDRKRPIISETMLKQIKVLTPSFKNNLKDGELRVTYINHSTVLLETEHANILTDPIFSNRSSPIQWAGPERLHAVPLSISELPHIDIVVVSHNHYDHMDMGSLREIVKKFDPLIIVPLGNKELLGTIQSKIIMELDWGQSYSDVKRNLEVTCVPAQHWSARGMGDKNRSLWSGFMFSVGGKEGVAQKNIYFAGDTGYSELLNEWLKKKFPKIRLALLPIGAFEPKWFMSSHHMSPDDAVKMADVLGVEESIGIHFGTFALADDGPLEAPTRVKEILQARPNLKFKTMNPGEQYPFH